MAWFNCITKEIEGHIRIVIDMLEKNIDGVSDSIEKMNGHAKTYNHYTREAGININQLKQTGRSMHEAMPIMYQATLSLPTDIQCNEDNNNKEKKGTTMRDKPYISKAERKKLKKGQTQGEVGDAGEVKENVAEKKKVKVVEPKDAQSSKVEGRGKDSREDEKEKLTDVDYVTGIPLSNDTLMYAVPVCAPYTALQSYEYRVKIIPGTTKKGKGTLFTYSEF
ncbi:nuclear export mediator factor NEMF [Tanacetum coccineum]